MMTAAPAPLPPTDGSRFLNRELSWLEFNARVLALAEDHDAAAARTRQVPRDLQPEPRRVLPGARVRARRSSSLAGVRGTSPDGLDQRRAAARDPRAGRRARARARRPSSPRTSRPSSQEAGIRVRRLGRARRRGPAELARGVRRPDLPGAHAARRRPRAPVPVHLEPVAEPRGRRARPDHRRGPLRAGQGAAAAPAVRRAARPRALRPARAGDRRPPRRAVPRAWTCSRNTRSASRATPTSSSRTRTRTCSRRSRSVLRQRTKFGRAVRLEVDADDVARGPRAAVP